MGFGVMEYLDGFLNGINTRFGAHCLGAFDVGHVDFTPFEERDDGCPVMLACLFGYLQTIEPFFHFILLDGADDFLSEYFLEDVDSGLGKSEVIPGGSREELVLLPFLEEISHRPALLGMGDEAHVAPDELRKRDGRIGFVETVDHDPVFGINDCFFYKPGL